MSFLELLAFNKSKIHFSCLTFWNFAFLLLYLVKVKGEESSIIWPPQSHCNSFIDAKNDNSICFLVDYTDKHCPSNRSSYYVKIGVTVLVLIVNINLCYVGIYNVLMILQEHEMANGWPLGLEIMNIRLRVVDSLPAAAQPYSLHLPSNSFSSLSSSNLDTEVIIPTSNSVHSNCTNETFFSTNCDI